MHDREYAISDSSGKLIKGKNNSLIYNLRSTFDLENETISFRHNDEEAWYLFHLEEEKTKIEAYLSDYFGGRIQLHQNKTGRFLDIPDLSGATVISTSSLKTVSEWYNTMSLDESRKRFRATLELEGVQAFWEDQLFSEEGKAIEFSIGDVKLLGVSPRARCVVPSRHPETGEVIQGFQKHFAQNRASSLPEWSKLKLYGHYYHLSVDCHIPDSEIGKWLEIGTHVIIGGEKTFQTIN